MLKIELNGYKIEIDPTTWAADEGDPGSDEPYTYSYMEGVASTYSNTELLENYTDSLSIAGMYNDSLVWAYAVQQEILSRMECSKA